MKKYITLMEWSKNNNISYQKAQYMFKTGKLPVEARKFPNKNIIIGDFSIDLNNKKICLRCGEARSIEYFTTCAAKRDGKSPVCNCCQAVYQKEYRKRYPEKAKKSREKSYLMNKEKHLECSRRWRENNREERLKRDCEKYHKIRKHDPKYKEANSKRSLEWTRKNKHNIAWRGLLRHTLEYQGKRKNTKCIKLLGYDATILKNHIESLWTFGMTWENYGEWHIDHIKRIIDFPKDTDPSVVNALSNLRPMWATSREINGVKYEGNMNRPKSKSYN